jgi:phosphatidylserine/phosphatidylglycerophosphate/cardiolipin synthase-like enzyme
MEEAARQRLEIFTGRRQPEPLSDMDELIKIFEKTFADKKFSRAEKKAVSQLLEQDYHLDKDQRDLLRSKIFDMARQEIDGNQNQAVIDWLEAANKLLRRPQDSAVYFSPGEECRLAIVDQLNRVLSSVDICVFTISDDRIAEAVMKCHERKVKVRIITDDEKIEDLGSDIRMFAAFGIETRVDNSPHHMHHKFAVFDHQRVLTGSYNWTRSAFERNQENILLTDDKRVVAAYREEFERLWNSMKPLDPLPPAARGSF